MVARQAAPSEHVLRKFNYDFLIGVGGIITCSVTLMIGLWEFTIASKEFVNFVSYPIARIAIAIASIFVGSGTQEADTAFWVYVSLWILHIIIFATTFWARVDPSGKRAPTANAILLMVQLISAVSGQKPLLYLFSFEVAFILPLTSAATWLISGLVLCAAVDLPPILFNTSITSSGSLQETLINLGYLATYCFMHFTVGLLAARERMQRQQFETALKKLASTNAELLATQILFSGAARASERARLARDIHDSIGHILTVQSLHLDLAMRTCGTEAASLLRKARNLTGNLLTEIRELVRTERHNSPTSLPQLLDMLSEDVTSPKISISHHKNLDHLNPAETTRIFQCIKEIVLEATRDTGASFLHLVLSPLQNTVTIDLVCDVHAAKKTEPNGLFLNARKYANKIAGSTSLILKGDGSLHMRILLPVTDFRKKHL